MSRALASYEGTSLGTCHNNIQRDGDLRVVSCSALPFWGASEKLSYLWQEENVHRVDYYTERSEDNWTTWIRCSDRKIVESDDKSLNSRSIGKALQRAPSQRYLHWASFAENFPLNPSTQSPAELPEFLGKGSTNCACVYIICIIKYTYIIYIYTMADWFFWFVTIFVDKITKMKPTPIA